MAQSNNLKLSRVCTICNDYRRKKDERRKKGEFKDKWYWTGHLIKRQVDHVCSIYKDSD